MARSLRPGWLGTFAAIFAGFAVTFILSVVTDGIMHAAGWFPPLGEGMSDSLFAVAASYRALYTILGGYVTARLAPARPMAHVAALIVLGLIGGFIGVWVYATGEAGTMGPAWYAYSIPLMTIPCIVLGAALASKGKLSRKAEADSL